MEYQVKEGQSIYDVAVATYGAASFAVKLLKDNPLIFPDINTVNVGTVQYDESLVIRVIPGVQLVSDAVPSGARSITGQENQSIFDLALLTVGTIDRVVEMVRNADRKPLSYLAANGRVFPFNLNSVSDINLYLFLKRLGTSIGGTIDPNSNTTGKAYNNQAYSNGYN
jgi:hypothetical protein